MEIIRSLHSNITFILLITILLAVLNAFIGLITDRNFGSREIRLSNYGLIFSLLQLIFGGILYFISEYLTEWKNGISFVVKDNILRGQLIEYPAINLTATILVAIGWSLHKKGANNRKKNFRIFIFYFIALLLFVKSMP